MPIHVITLLLYGYSICTSIYGRLVVSLVCPGKTLFTLLDLLQVLTKWSYPLYKIYLTRSFLDSAHWFTPETECGEALKDTGFPNFCAHFTSHLYQCFSLRLASSSFSGRLLEHWCKRWWKYWAIGSWKSLQNTSTKEKEEPLYLNLICNPFGIGQ